VYMLKLLASVNSKIITSYSQALIVVALNSEAHESLFSAVR